MPGLAIAVGGDIRPFENAMKTALGVATQTATSIGAKYVAAASGIDKAFAQTARNVGTQFGKGISDGAVPALNALKTTALLAVGAFVGFEAAKLGVAAMGAAAAAAATELDRMAKIGADAAKFGVSSTFLQTYSAQARNLKVDVDDLTKSLTMAREAFTVRQGQGGEDARNESAFGARLRQQMDAGNVTAAQVSRFGAAIGTEAQFKAAVDIMAELQAKGRDLAALDLASKIFPPELVERIRTGAVEMSRFRQMIDEVKNPDLTLLKPDEIVRAQELKRRLEEAQATLDQAARDFNLELGRAGVGLREDAIAWKELMASGARAAVGILQQARQIRDQMAANEPAVFGRDYYRKEDAPASGLLKDLGKPTSAPRTGDREMDNALDKLRGNLGNKTLVDQAMTASQQMTAGMRPDKTAAIITSRPTARSPSSSESLDQVETYVRGLEKSAAALKGEVDAIGKSNAERQVSINLQRAEEIARQQNRALSEDEIRRIRETSIATAEYRDKLEDAREAQEALRSTGRSVLSGIVSDARNGVPALDLLLNALNRVLDRLADQGVNALTDVLFGRSGSTQGGLLGSLLSGAGGFSGANFSNFLSSGLSFSPIPGFATGTILNGPGTGTSDSIVARLSHGEAVIPARVVSENRQLVEALITDRLPRFALGGVIEGGDDRRFTSDDRFAGLDQSPERRTTKNLSSAIGALSEMSGAGGEMTVNVHPPSNTVPEVQKRRTPTGQAADVMIRQVLAEDLGSNGPLAQAMQNLYGLNRMSGRQI